MEGYANNAWVVASYTRRFRAERGTVLTAHHTRVNPCASPMLGRYAVVLRTSFYLPPRPLFYARCVGSQDRSPQSAEGASEIKLTKVSTRALAKPHLWRARPIQYRVCLQADRV
jgi:hypothetical protein